jgi:hypothetical protein
MMELEPTTTSSGASALVPESAASSSPLVHVTPSRFFSPRDAMTIATDPVAISSRADSSSGASSAKEVPSALASLADSQKTLRRQFESRPLIAFRRDRRRFPQGPETVEVPLLPASYLATRDVTGPDVNTELLHESIQRNALLQTRDKTHFRCLRCFHIFETRPSVELLRTTSEVTSWEKNFKNAARKRQRAMDCRRPSLAAKQAAPFRRLLQERAEPTQCPMCRSRKCQWLLDYVHRKTVQRATSVNDGPFFSSSGVPETTAPG